MNFVGFLLSGLRPTECQLNLVFEHLSNLHALI